MINMLKNLHKEESGQDLIEYALIALIIALGALVGMGSLASSINAGIHQDRCQAHLIEYCACWKQAMQAEELGNRRYLHARPRERLAGRVATRGSSPS